MISKTFRKENSKDYGNPGFYTNTVTYYTKSQFSIIKRMFCII